MRVFRCKQCKSIVEADYDVTTSDTFVNRCSALFGRYCVYEELVPKHKCKKAKRVNSRICPVIGRAEFADFAGV